MESPHDMTELDMSPPVEQSLRIFRALRTKERSGQAIVELAIVSVVFFMMVFGTIDFGRATYMYSQLENAVREGARYGKMNPTANYDIEDIVLNQGSGLDMRPDDITISCTGGCYPGCADITVSATALFTPVTASFLGIGPDDLPIHLHSSATVTSE
jgi:hypothetical protein